MLIRDNVRGQCFHMGTHSRYVPPKSPRDSNIGGSGDRTAGGILPLLGGRAAPQVSVAH